MEEHGFGEVWRAFLAGLPVADFDDPTVAEDFVRRITLERQTRGGNPPSRHATVVWGERMSKTKTRAARATAFAILTSAFPKTFMTDPKCRRPVEIGIGDDLMARIGDAVPRRDLRFAIMLYCSSVGYLQNAKPGPSASISTAMRRVPSPQRKRFTPAMC